MMPTPDAADFAQLLLREQDRVGHADEIINGGCDYVIARATAMAWKTPGVPAITPTERLIAMRYAERVRL